MQRTITVALSVVLICAVIGAFVFRNLALSVFAVVSLLFLVITAAGAGHLVSSCNYFRGRAGTLRIWGISPQQIGNSDVILERVWALGAGLHFSVSTPDATSRTHIKVAQPRHWSIERDTLTIGDAKYVQIRGVTVERAAGAPALQFGLAPAPGSK